MSPLSLGHGERKEIPSDYREISDLWEKGIMRTARYPDAIVGEPIDWNLNPYDGSWLFKFHSLEYLFCLFKSFDITKDAKYKNTMKKIVSTWISAHPEPESGTPPWMRHTTALRAQALAYGASYLSHTEAYLASLNAHGTFLADPANYSGAWNHGLDESLALLAVGATLSNQEWIDLAVARATDALNTMCDCQGATNEQASVYHFYVWKQFGQFEEELDRCGIQRPPELGRRREIIDFLVHASMPDGRLVAIGDSLPTVTPAIEGTSLEYTANRGTKGIVPGRTVQVFDRGWAFVRTGWGTVSDFEDESVLVARFGPGRAVHGHSDHTSFYYYSGRRLVVGDAGFSGYADAERRYYELNEYGHSQVVVSGAGPYRPTAYTDLTVFTDTRQWKRMVFKDNPYTGVTRQRSVTFVLRPECVVVQDELELLSDDVVVRQLFHLGTTLKPLCLNNHEATFVDRMGSVVIKQLVPVSNIDVAYGTSGSKTIGWVGTGLGRHAKGVVVSTRGFTARGHCSFHTVISKNPRLRVNLASGYVKIGDLELPLADMNV